ncbi:hypothetical protein J2S43_001565 [Catenuloplanes nepalensis]|uniref:Uncharacterized protein n=1 Tax=Catenuloplanes nepalensis TaxID=587533 RepID=A0ABT9MP41_9ACTN|nr:hypothetical protein [Catenuloplanes nepalensis]
MRARITALLCALRFTGGSGYLFNVDWWQLTAR